MKRILALILCFAVLFCLVLSLASCKNKGKDGETPAPDGGKEGGAGTGNGSGTGSGAGTGDGGDAAQQGGEEGESDVDSPDENPVAEDVGVFPDED